MRAGAEGSATRVSNSRSDCIWPSRGRLLWHIADTEDEWVKKILLKVEFVPRYGVRALTKGTRTPSWDGLTSYVEESRAQTLQAIQGVRKQLAPHRVGRRYSCACLLKHGCLFDWPYLTGRRMFSIARYLARSWSVRIRLFWASRSFCPLFRYSRPLHLTQYSLWPAFR